MPLLCRSQEIEDVRPLETHTEDRNEVDLALAWHDGDARATIATLLADCRHLRRQIEIADQALSRGFTRGWRPTAEPE